MNRERPYLTLVYCLLLALGTLAVYSRVKSLPFITFDDEHYITQNMHVQAGLSWKTFTWALNSTEADNWHPLTWLSHALDCQLYGLNPAGHHLTNLLLHSLNVVLLFLLLVSATGARGRSFLVAALFALHPLNVESVAWVAERKNVLSTCFFLLTLGVYGWYTRKPSVRRYLAVAALFVLGLACKPMVITIPFVLLLLDYWPLSRIQGREVSGPPGRKGRQVRKRQSNALVSGSAFLVPQAPLSRLVLEKLPLLVFCAASALITILAQQTGGAIRSMTYFSLPLRLENAVSAYGAYVWEAFWPTRLGIFYPFPRNGVSALQIGLSTVFLVGTSSLVWKYRLTKRYLVAGWLWYLGIMVPVIGLIQVGDQARADRYAYIPLIGIFVMMVWSAADLADRRAINFRLRSAIAIIVLAVLSFRTWRQVGYWQSEYDLWSHTLEVTGVNYIAEANLARALRMLGRPEDALPHFQAAASLNPGDPGRHVNLAADLAECGRLQDAIKEYTSAIALTPDPGVQARGFESIASLYAALGDYAKVRESYKAALQLDPEQADQMIGHLSQSVAAQPAAETYLQLGLLQEQAGHPGEARDAYEQAIKLDPSIGEGQEFLRDLGQNDRSAKR